MKDRVSLYPGRVKLTPVSGQENTYDMVRADEPTQEGTPFNKSTFLKDDTAALFGLGTNAVPDDVFSDLSNCASEIFITTYPGAIVTASLNGKMVSGTADSFGLAVLKLRGFGICTVSSTAYGLTASKDIEINSMSKYEMVVASDLELTGWDVIDTISNTGIASSLWSIGDKKTITIDGINYQVQIIGFDHDDKTDGGKAGITFQMVDCLNTAYRMNASNTNVGGWTSCEMRSSTLVALLTKLPSALQNVIKTVNKLTSAGNQSNTINTASDKLFLLSEVEIFGSTTYSKSGEGNQYAYYKAGNSKVKKVNGSANNWWERSPIGSNSDNFCSVDSNGNTIDGGNASYSRGVAFGFCV